MPSIACTLASVCDGTREPPSQSVSSSSEVQPEGTSRWLLLRPVYWLSVLLVVAITVVAWSVLRPVRVTRCGWVQLLLEKLSCGLERVPLELLRLTVTGARGWLVRWTSKSACCWPLTSWARTVARPVRSAGVSTTAG